MPGHIRIRIVLVIAVAVICGGLFAISELQRRSDTSAFAEYATAQELRSTGVFLARAIDEAQLHGRGASDDVATAQRAVFEAIDHVRSRPDRAEKNEQQLIEEQAVAAVEMSRLAGDALRHSTARLDARADALLDRFITASDELLDDLAAERAGDRTRAARRPVILVLVLSLLFGFAHLLLVERPAMRERRNRREQREFGDAIQVARCEEEAYDVLSRHVARAAGARHVTVLNRNNSDNRLEAVTAVEQDSPVAEALDGAVPDSCLAVRLARTRHVSSDEEPLLRCDICGASREQTTCVPSLVGGEVVGAVLVEHEGGLAAHRRRLVERSVAEAAPVIANLRSLAVAEVRAATDGLTGLPNQRAVHDTVKRAAALAGRTKSPLALILFDLDHFKAINDAFGHGKGDEVLAAVGAIAAESLRTSDFVGRLGGEEFVVVLPATDRAGGVNAAEKLRGAIETITVPGVNRSVTASFGVAVMPDDAGEPERLLREADRALYYAKNNGRNRVETTSRDPQPPASVAAAEIPLPADA